MAGEGRRDETSWWERWGCLIITLLAVIAFCTSVWWLPYDAHLAGQFLRWLMTQ